MFKKSQGFTIVELLVVIVVIGILATITIVSYVNIQGRAQDTARVSTSKQLEKSISIKGTLSGQYTATPSERASKESFLSAYDIASLGDSIAFDVNCWSNCDTEKIHLFTTATYGGEGHIVWFYWSNEQNQWISTSVSDSGNVVANEWNGDVPALIL